MSKTYTDYINKIALTVPDEFIDVKTGASRPVSPKVEEQIEYHTNNGTLVDFIFSALNQYLKPKAEKGMNEEILQELSEIKKMIERGYVPRNFSPQPILSKNRDMKSQPVDLREVEDILDAFGG
ncbi:hypothetical protein [Priestia abyssalis]|uniref:hypothetical protein n=1 Tax=Priestia abyssalis TaxID=1221450 RepID=UPI000995C62E|nr:hypothetical protein [Priestia abyssalis]